MRLRVISLGAGVQSTTMLLMALTGELERPDCAIFADTQWEPANVYQHLKWIEKQCREKFDGFPVYRVTAGNLPVQITQGAVDGSQRFVSIPMHIKNLDGQSAITRRQCTREFKVEPIQRKIRELLGVPRGARVPKDTAVESWQGISLDEASRMRDAKLVYITNVYPLIDKRMTRRDCLDWLRLRGYPEPPKSSCLGCPYHSDRQWREIKARPDEWANVVAFDKAMRTQYKLDGEAFLHRSLKPLDEVDLRSAEEMGQANLFENDCESGVCGV